MCVCDCVYVYVYVCVCFFFIIIWRVGSLLLQPKEFDFKFGGDNFETP